MTSRRPNILVSSAGRRGELVQIFKRTLADRGRGGKVFTADMSPLSSAGRLGDGHQLVPRVDDPAFVPSVLDLCERLDVGHVIPTIDPELPVYATSRVEFAAAGTHVWVSSPETIAIARDKRRTNAFLRENSFEAVRQWDLEAALAAEDLPFPVIAKPAAGSASTGLTRVRDVAGLHSLDASLDYVIEGIAPGHEHTIDVLVDPTGRCRMAVPRRRLEVRAGEVSKGVTVSMPRLEDFARAVVSRLPGAFGILNLQVFVDEPSGALALIEVNARFGGGFPLAWHAGAAAPAWMLDALDGLSPHADPTWRAGLVMMRYDQGTYADAAELGLRIT